MYNRTYIVKCALGFQLTKDNGNTQDDSFARLMVLHVFGLDIRDVVEVLQQQNEICFTNTRINKSLIITLLRIDQENTNENDQHITTTAEWTIDCDVATIYALQTFNLALVDLKKYFSYEEDLLEVIENDINENEPFILLDSLSNTIDDQTFSNEKPFQSTYRQRNEEFRKVFKDLSNDERLIVDYSCAWQKEILIQGRMYISQNYLCFYANFLKWETSLCLKFKDIVAITREKTAKVIPNAIEIRSNKNEKYFFASFATRDKTYAMIYRIWQSILIDQPISSQQLWNLIHQCYGNDLDMTTDEEDTYNKQSKTSTPEKNSPKQQTKNETNDKYCSVTPNSLCSKSSEKEEIDDHSSISSYSGRQIDDDNYNDDDNQGIIPIGEEANTNTLIRQSNSNINKQDNSFITMSIIPETNYLSKCPCESHLATQLIDRTYSLSVERLFDCLFGDNDFVVAYHASRRIKDYHADEWNHNEKTGKRERLCTYKVGVAAVFGATTICSNEKQVIQCELSKSHYIVDTEVRNEGIKYADAFFVASRYCLVQTGPNKSHLKVTCEVRYLKSLMIIIKSFIEKNAMAALQDSYTDLIKRIDINCSKRPRSSSTTRNTEQDKENQPKRKHSQKQQLTKLNSTTNDSSIDQQRKQTTHKEPIHHTQIPFCLIIILILVSVNIFLCIKLNEIDQMTDRLSKNSPLWSQGYSQEEHYQEKLIGLRSVLISTHNALKNVTDALNELTKVSSGTSSNAPMDHLHSL
ncbi:unnamed protein product [Rotaria sp. Silwood1]|nr:unnamed protein product [Rotaria sp. Silwood1]